MDLAKLVRQLVSQRVRRFKTVVVNMSEAIKTVSAQHMKEIIGIVDELQNGVYTFEYSTTGLSKNMQAKLKRIQFAKKNIPHNIQAFVQVFTPEAIADIVAADAITDIYNLLHDIQQEYGDVIQITIVFEGSASAQCGLQAARRALAEQVWRGVHQLYTEQFQSSIKKNKQLGDQYEHQLRVNLQLSDQLVRDRLSQIIKQAEHGIDNFSRSIHEAHILNSAGPATRFIPQYIQSKYESRDAVLVVDPNHEALMIQLMSGTSHTLYMNSRFIYMPEARSVISQLFGIPEEQCQTMARLYAITHMQQVPRMQTIEQAGSFLSVHCYMYSKYMTKHWRSGPITAEFVLKYLQSYSNLNSLMQSSRINTRLYPHIGGILIYSNAKMTKISKEVMFKKKSLRRVFRVQSPYTQALASVYILNDNKRLTSQGLELSPQDVMSYINFCIHESAAADNKFIWTTRAPNLAEVCQTTHTTNGLAHSIQHGVGYVQQSFKCQASVQQLVRAIAQGKQIIISDVDSYRTITEVDFCGAEIK